MEVRELWRVDGGWRERVGGGGFERKLVNEELREGGREGGKV
jgi:hypothetical protein